MSYCYYCPVFDYFDESVSLYAYLGSYLVHDCHSIVKQ